MPPAKPKQPEPLLKTPADQINKVEQFKLQSQGARGRLHEDFRDRTADDVIEETEQIAKSHGVYMEYNRAKTGREKDWMYMVRISVPGGGAFNAKQWRLLNDLADRYTINPDQRSSLRLTTRQNIQFHWVKKQNLIPLVRDIAQTGFYALNGCGDNTRNVMACPLSMFSDLHNAHALAHQFGAYFRLPAEPHIHIFEIDTQFISTPEKHFEYGPQLLNRKFKIAFSAAHRNEQTGKIEYDNCVELRTNEIGAAPVVENERVAALMVYIGGGQGEKFGKPTFAALGRPFGVFTPENLLTGLDAIVKVHQEWGDRKNRHWARMKYVVQKQGIPWFQQQARTLGAEFDQPIPDFDPGPRRMHHGWSTLPTTGKLAFGAYVENGRLIDSPPTGTTYSSGVGNGDLKKMSLAMLEKFPGVELMSTPNQDLLFVNIESEAKQDFDAALREFGYGQRNGRTYSRLRVLSGACVGLPTCRLATADSELYEPHLIDELEQLGYGDMNESIGVTGCERQCFRPATKTIGWIGQGPQRYALKLGGSEDGRHQGQWLTDGEQWFLAQVPKEEVPAVTTVLFDFYMAGRLNDAEDMGSFHRRLGVQAMIAHLRSNAKTAALMEKTRPAPYVPPDNEMSITAPAPGS